jgi:SLIT-ROBO Rho GTPase activating protein
LVQKSILDELECRKSKLKERLTTLRTESEEIWKSMETAERSLNDIVAANDFDTTR